MVMMTIISNNYKNNSNNIKGLYLYLMLSNTSMCKDAPCHMFKLLIKIFHNKLNFCTSLLFVRYRHILN